MPGKYLLLSLCMRCSLLAEVPPSLQTHPSALGGREAPPVLPSRAPALPEPPLELGTRPGCAGEAPPQGWLQPARCQGEQEVLRVSLCLP